MTRACYMLIMVIILSSYLYINPEGSGLPDVTEPAWRQSCPQPRSAQCFLCHTARPPAAPATLQRSPHLPLPDQCARSGPCAMYQPDLTFASRVILTFQHSVPHFFSFVKGGSHRCLIIVRTYTAYSKCSIIVGSEPHTVPSTEWTLREGLLEEGRIRDNDGSESEKRRC